ncbi:RagB/SusD family nutrient uptake outer membrane protein [Bacteroides fragilis]|uniref:RagB/SusD family nutrient uptake outer membrane protein n=1 Tax=Bacteroides fragilis TaxID=817 RepID=A0A9X9NFF0_BACFG|nr:MULTISPECIES: RagB/SusD family nutrient uptake outer membrane protein [Bacteroidales]MCS2902126.1 RagB/SusD family nutrient uptake outer membrane protein [Bacteroides thetaiotaomicron]MDB9117268.1 RagB/SusD family nutrient uptake outer membrane protein [Parabacteroides merdae]UVO89614.1 RagB/SusD family nutrient uptake outer membrane protein [Bacteroides fragilis]
MGNATDEFVETISLNSNSTTTDRHVWILFRYAEVLLNYTEAFGLW